LQSSQTGCRNHRLNNYRTLRCHLYCHFFSTASVRQQFEFHGIYGFERDFLHLLLRGRGSRGTAAALGHRTLEGESPLCIVPPTAQRVRGCWSHWCGRGSWESSGTFRSPGSAAAQASSRRDVLADLWVQLVPPLPSASIYKPAPAASSMQQTTQPEHPLQQPAPPPLTPRSFQSATQTRLSSWTPSEKRHPLSPWARAGHPSPRGLLPSTPCTPSAL